MVDPPFRRHAFQYVHRSYTIAISRTSCLFFLLLFSETVFTVTSFRAQDNYPMFSSFSNRRN